MASLSYKEKQRTEALSPFLADYIDLYLDYCRVGKGLSDYSIKSYRCDYNDFLLFAGPEVLVDSLTKEKIIDYARFLLDVRKLKATSLKRRLASLKVLCRWLELEGHVALSPFHNLSLPIKLPKQLPRALHFNEIRALVRQSDQEQRMGVQEQTLPSDFHLILLLLLLTGVRVGELVAIALDTVDPDRGAIKIHGKGSRERLVYITDPDVQDMLRSHCQKIRNNFARTGMTQRFLFADPYGAPLTTQDIRLALRALAVRAGLTRRITPHMLRHTAATQLLEAGVDIRFVQRLLGHAHIGTTQIYTAVSDEALRESLAKTQNLRLWKG